MATKTTKKSTTKTMSYSDYDGNPATSSGYSTGENKPMTRSSSSSTSGVKTDSKGNLIPGQSFYKGGAAVPASSTYADLQALDQGRSGVSTVSTPQSRAKLAVSTTTISNQNKISQVPQIINTTNKYADTGITTDENGVAKYANGTMVPDAQAQASPKVDLSKDVSQGGYYGDMYYAPGANIPTGKDGKAVKLRETSVSDDKIMSNIDRLQSQSDKITASVIDSIKSNYAALKQQQEIANQQQQAGNQTALLMGGVTGQGSSSQYAPISSQNIMAATINYGISKISALASQEASAVVEAQQAGLNNNFRLMDEKNKQIERIRDEKVQATIKLNESIQKQSEKMAEESMQMTKDTAVADLVSQGITDPAVILNQLKSMGLTISAKEIDAALGVFAGNMETTLSDIRDAGVSTRFANAGGELQDARSGYRYKSEEDFLTKTGMTPQQAQDAGMVTDYTPGQKFESEEDKGFTLSPGQARYDADGNLIAQADPKDEGDDKPAPEVIDAAGSNLQANAGKDGYISPEVYNDGLEQWLDAGYTADSYYKNYKKFVNPANPQDYNYYPKANGATSTQDNSGSVKGWTAQAAKLPLLDQNGKEMPLPKVYPPNSDGGQCGVFVRNLTKKQGLTYPPVGDTLATKTATVQKYGSKTGSVGSVLITSENKQSGHVAYIIGRSDKGWILAESNYGNDERVDYGRVIPFNSPSIIGYIKPHK